jgi:ERCC4-type nuclease
MHRFNTFKERIDKQTLYSAMFSINYFKGFSVMRSNGIEETALIACNMAFKLVSSLASGKKGFYSSNLIANALATNATNNIDETTLATDKDYCSVVKKVKKDNITPENIGEIMLCQIPGISVATALAILAQFNTLPNLIKNIQENPTCLNGICTTDANGKNRKLSKTAIASVIKFLGN